MAWPSTSPPSIVARPGQRLRRPNRLLSPGGCGLPHAVPAVSLNTAPVPSLTAEFYGFEAAATGERPLAVPVRHPDQFTAFSLLAFVAAASVQGAVLISPVPARRRSGNTDTSTARRRRERQGGDAESLIRRSPAMPSAWSGGETWAAKRGVAPDVGGSPTRSWHRRRGMCGRVASAEDALHAGGGAAEPTVRCPVHAYRNRRIAPPPAIGGAARPASGKSSPVICGGSRRRTVKWNRAKTCRSCTGQLSRLHSLPCMDDATTLRKVVEGSLFALPVTARCPAACACV